MRKEMRSRRRRGPGEGTIFERANGSWCAQLRVPGGRRISRHFKTRRAAQTWLAQTITERDDGLLLETGQITLAQYLERWLEDSARPTVRPRTYESYAGLVHRHILPHLGQVRLAQLRPDHLQHFYTSASAAGLSPRTVRYLHAVLHRALERAVRWGLLTRNVTDAVDPPRFVCKALATLDPAQVRRLLQGLEGDPLYPLYLLAISTGMRRGELLGLHWSELDLEGATVRVVGSLQRLNGYGLVLGEPKSQRGRRAIALSPSVVSVLRQHRARQMERKLALGSRWSEQDYVFTSTGGRPLDPRGVLRHFKALLERLGLPSVRFHDLRHTAATLLLAAGTHPKIVQEMLGHSSITLTLDTYSHVLPDMQREAAQRMELLLAGGEARNEVR